MMREEALYSVSKCSLMQDRAWSTFATLPLARAKARRVISASGLTQQLHRSKKKKQTQVGFGVLLVVLNNNLSLFQSVIVILAK